MPHWFWSSDKLTGIQTYLDFETTNTKFWSSDKLTGIQTELAMAPGRVPFWSSDKLTGIQTRAMGLSESAGFGAVTN